jgi:PKD repeat protein
MSKRSPLRQLSAQFLLLLLPAASSLLADDAGGQVTIDSPSRNTIIRTSAIYVSGTALARSRDIGVVVNGVAAEIDLDHEGTIGDPFRWFASVSAPPGMVKLKARLKTPKTEDRDDGAADDSGPAGVRFIEFTPSDQQVDIEANPSNGLAPLAVQFSIDAVLTADLARFEIDFDGDGSFDVTSSSIPDELSFTYSTPGLRLVTARLTFGDGSTATAMTAVAPQSFATINSVLQGVWRGFGDARRRKRTSFLRG